MALLPYALRPSVIIRRKAIWQGILGPSTLWKVVAAWVFGKGSLKKFFGKQVEVIGTEKVGKSAFANVITVAPMTKKQQKATGVNRKMLEARAASDVADSWANKVAAKPNRKNRRRAAKTETMAAAAQAKADKAQRKSRKKAS